MSLRAFFQFSISFVLICLGVSGAASNEIVIIETSASKAQALVLGTVVQNVSDKVSIHQSDIWGETTSSALGTISDLEADITTFEMDSPLVLGPATLTVFNSESANPASDNSDLESAVGMRFGDLEPNFTLAGGNSTGSAGDDPTTVSATQTMAHILTLVREWIAVAEPPQNAQPGYILQYTNWAQLVGKTPTGIITANAKPDDVGGLPFDQYLWTRHPDLDSLNHCTLSQYVVLRQSSKSLESCGTNSPLSDRQTSSTADENEELTTAQPITENTTLAGSIFPRSDNDEFMLLAPHQGEWQISILSAPAGVDLVLGVYPAPNGGWITDMSPSGDGKIVVDLPAPAAYILRVSATSGNMESQDTYKISSQFIRSPDLFEPNNSVAEAEAIDGNRQIIGTILPRRDQDEFIFEADHQGEWTIDITSQPEGLALNLGVYPHPNGGWITDMSPSGDGKIVVDLPAPGKYVLRANAASGNSRSIEPYNLDLSFIRSPDLFEPNNSVAEAEAIDGNRQIIGTILPRRDQDEFIFEADHQGEWTIDITSQPEGLALNLGVYTHPNGGWITDMSPSGDGKIVVDLPAPGKYVLRANAASGNSRSIEPYNLDLNFIRSPDLFEPNNSVAEAEAIDGNQQIIGTILPRRDQDEFIFEADHQGEWTIDITSQPEGLALNLGVYPHPNGGWITDISPSGDGKIVVDLPAPGKYVLRANAASGNSRSIELYNLDLSFTRSPDIFEPNNSTAEAKTIDGNRQIIGTILPRGDQDEFIFEADHQGEWTIDITSQPEGLALNLGVYPHPNGGWITDISPSGDGKIVVDLPAPGKYVLRANAASGNSRSIEPYNLDLSFNRSSDLFEPNNSMEEAKIHDGKLSCEWVNTGILGDYKGKDDLPFSMGSSIPDPARCDKSYAGNTADCFDNKAAVHSEGEVFCTYKHVRPTDYFSGVNNGRVHECICK